MYKHILVPTDGSPVAEDGVRAAVAFAKEVGARITAVMVKQSSFTEQDFVQHPRFDSLAEQVAREDIGAVEKLCGEAGVNFGKFTVTNRSADEGIIEAASQCGCDLIFMASHGHSGLAAVFLGSVAAKVIAHSRIPVLVHRH